MYTFINIRFPVSVCITISVSMIVFYAFCQAQGKKTKTAMLNLMNMVSERNMSTAVL